MVNLGSTDAFNAIISLNLVSLMLTYCLSIGYILLRRIQHPELLPKGRWSLGKWGVFVNTVGFFVFPIHVILVFLAGRTEPRDR